MGSQGTRATTGVRPWKAPEAQFLWQFLDRVRVEIGQSWPGNGTAWADVSRSRAKIIRKCDACRIRDEFDGDSGLKLANIGTNLAESSQIWRTSVNITPNLVCVHTAVRREKRDSDVVARASQAESPFCVRGRARLAPRGQKAQAPEPMFAMLSMSPRRILGGEVGVREDQGDVLTPITDRPAFRNTGDHAPNNVPIFATSDAIDQPPLE